MSNWKKAFSLVEVIAVIAIGTILMTLVIPAVTGIVQGNGVSTAGTTLIQRMQGARELALSRARIVEFRFYKGADGQFASVQTFILDDTGKNPQPVDAVANLPAGCVVSNDKDYSTLLNPGHLSGESSLPQAGQVEWVAFRFRPDGTADLPRTAAGANTWFLTVHSGTDRSLPPKNYFTIQLNPLTGRFQTFRP